MPELPEVETVRRGLEKLIVGRKISSIDVLNEKSFQDKNGEILPVNASEVQKNLLGAKIIAARRRAKVLMIDLDTKYSLVIHLKMTGQIVFRGDENWGGGHPTESFVANLPDKSTRIIFHFNDQTNLFFNDQRKFGWIKFMPKCEIENLKFIKKLAPEMSDFRENSQQDLGEKIDKKVFDEFIKRARKHNNSPVKSVILNQEVVAGIGNIYADESLWSAKIHPATRVKNLNDETLQEVLTQAKIAMEKSLAAGGSTMKNYIKADGSRGDYLETFANVFAKNGESCPRCGDQIIKIKVAGRGTHLCPTCQKEIK